MDTSSEDVKQLLALMDQYGVTFDDLGIHMDNEDEVRAHLNGESLDTQPHSNLSSAYYDDNNDIEGDYDDDNGQDDGDHVNIREEAPSAAPQWPSAAPHPAAVYYDNGEAEFPHYHTGMQHKADAPESSEESHRDDRKASRWGERRSRSLSSSESESSSEASRRHRKKAHKSSKNKPSKSKKSHKSGKSSRRERRRRSETSTDSSSTSAESHLSEVVSNLLRVVTNRNGNTANNIANTATNVPTADGSSTPSKALDAAAVQARPKAEESELTGSSVPMFVPFSPSPVKQPISTQQQQQQTTQQQLSAPQVPLAVAAGAVDGVAAGDGHVVVLLSSLRQQAATLADLENELRIAVRERDSAEAKADSLATKLAAAENEQDRERMTFRAEMDRLSQSHANEVIRLKDMHSSEITRLHMSHESELARLTTTLRLKEMEIDHLRSREPSQSTPQHHSPTDEEFIIMSEEVDRLQQTINKLNAELQYAHSELARRVVAVHDDIPRDPASARESAYDLAPSAGRSPSGASRPMSTAAKIASMKKGFDPFAPSAENEFVMAHSAPSPTDVRQSRSVQHAPMPDDVPRLRKQLQAAMAEVEELRTALDAERRKTVELSSSLASRQEEINRLSNQLDQSKAQAASAERDARNAMANMQAVEAEADKRRMRIQQLEEKLSEVAKLLASREHDLNDAKRQLPLLQQQNAARVSELDSARLEIVQLRDQLKQLQASRDGFPVAGRKVIPSPPRATAFMMEPHLPAGFPDRADDRMRQPIFDQVDAPRSIGSHSMRQHADDLVPQSRMGRSFDIPERDMHKGDYDFGHGSLPVRQREAPAATRPAADTRFSDDHQAVNSLEAELAAAKSRFYEAERERQDMTKRAPPAQLFGEPYSSAPQARSNPYEGRSFRDTAQATATLPARHAVPPPLSIPLQADSGEAERQRRMAILADIAASQRRPVTYGPSAAMDFNTGAAAAHNHTTSGMEDALPMSSAAFLRQQEEASRREAHRVSKSDADSAARDRESHAPFATQASHTDIQSAVASKESLLMQLSQAKAAVESELEKIGPGAPRTLKDRERKNELTLQLAQAEKRLGEVRIWLKMNAKQ